MEVYLFHTQLSHNHLVELHLIHDRECFSSVRMQYSYISDRYHCTCLVLNNDLTYSMVLSWLIFDLKVRFVLSYVVFLVRFLSQ